MSTPLFPLMVELERRRLDGSTTWTDVTCDVMSVESSRGRQNVLERYRTSIVRIRLYNPNGTYSPWHPAGTFQPVDAGLGVRITTTDPDAVLPIAYATVDICTDLYEPHPTEGMRAYVEIDAVDGFERLAAHDGPERPQVGAGERSGARIARLLSDADWNAATDLDDGVATMQPTTLAGRTLEEIWLTADSDGGTVYCDAAGTFVFRDVNAHRTRTRSTTPQAVFSTKPVGDELCAAFLRSACDRELLVNDVRIARAGGTARHAVSPSSIARYGVRTFARSDLRHDTDDHSSLLATTLAGRSADSVRRITSLTVDLQRHPHAVEPVCRLELGDLITVRHFPPGGWSYSVDLLVQGIVHRVTPSGWAVELATGPKPAGDAVADPQPPTDVRAVHASASTLSVTWTPAAVNNETGFRVSVDTGGTPTVIEVPAGSASAVISCPANLHANVTVTAWNAAGTATSTRTPVVPHVTPTPLVSVSFLWPLGAPNLTYDATWSPDPATACPQCGLTNDYRWPVTITDPSSTVRVDTHTVDPVRTITGQTAAVDGTWRTVVHLIDQVGTTSTTVDTVVNPPTATARPPAPLGVRLDFTDPTRLTVIWNDPANPAAPNEIDAIEILVRTAATDYGPPAVSVAWTGATGRTWSFPNPLPDTDYHVTVRTRNEAGTGDTVVSGWTRPPVGTVKVLNARWIDTWTSAKGWRSDATYYAGRWSTLYETQQIVIGWGTNAVELCRGHHPAKVEIVGTRAASGGMTGAKVRIAGHANASTTKPATIPTPVPPWQENALVQPVAGATATGTLTALDRAGMATGTITGLILAAPDTLQANYSVWSTLVVKVTF